MFNKGFICATCGPIEKSKKRNINKIPTNCCATCDKPVKEWVRPLKERAGRCSNCGHGSFKSAFHNRMLLRCCKNCEEVVNIDKNMEVVRKGKIQIES